MTTEHKYANILRAIADGKTVQWLDSQGNWLDQEPRVALSTIAYGSYSPDRYRIKPRTININGYEVPEPVRKPLNHGQQYWIACLQKNRFSNFYPWGESEIDYQWLADGAIHLTQEAAELHSKALLSFTAKK